MDEKVKIDLAEVLAHRQAAANPQTPQPQPAPAPTAEAPPEVVTPEVPPPDPFLERLGLPEDAVRKALEYKWVEEDPFIKKALETYRTGKPLNEIVSILGKDWTKADDREVLRESLSREGITDKELQDYRIQQIYGGYDAEDESPEARLARIEVSRKAADSRQKLIEEQQSFGSPINHPEKELQELQRQLEDWHGLIDRDPATQILKTTGRMALTLDGQTQNLEVNADAVTALIKNPGDLLGKIGELPLEKALQIAAFISDPDTFVRQWAELGKVQAREAMLREARNPEPVTPATPPMPDLKGKELKDMTPEEKRAFISGLRRVN